ncbi:hypothetical protein JYU34_000005 [Plutella xylostella]|uniref:Mutant cadherin n=1 Tax=Plutella xylostella TaxID=51655 RepID=A0ABQ7R6T1_PLUXY|nr:hypothetical protein JYU34_000005 [Plutella xylostella]
MTSTVVKCQSCNIVISEILCFIQNKIDVMDDESLMLVCSKFTEDEVEAGKRLLFDSVVNAGRMLSRKGDGKKSRNLEDIICLMKRTLPEMLPIFVARDLNKLPPVTFDHIDVTALLKDILVIKKEINTIKTSYATSEELIAVKSDISLMKTASLINTDNEYLNNINSKRGGFMRESFFGDSGPIGLSAELNPKESIESIKRVDNTDIGKNVNSAPEVNARASTAYASVTKQPGKRVEAPQSTAVTTSPPATKQVASRRAPSSDRIAAPSMRAVHNTDRQDQLKEDDWILVHRKKKERFQGKKGMASIDAGCKFKSADVKMPIYIYNVSKDTTEGDIKDYILAKTNILVNPEKITAQEEKEYNSFKIYISRNKWSLFDDSTLWPEGILFRKYFLFNKHRTTQEVQMRNSTQQQPNGSEHK